MAIANDVLECLSILSNEARELYLRETVPEIVPPVSPLQFYREWVSPNLPVLLKGAVKHWPAIKKWCPAYFRLSTGDTLGAEVAGEMQGKGIRYRLGIVYSIAGPGPFIYAIFDDSRLTPSPGQVLARKPVTVAVTPNGYADAVAIKSDDGSMKEYFVMPEERTMTMDEFFCALDDQEKYRGVFYIQRQNSNLSDDFPELLCDCAAHIPWASDAFGCMPDAVNLWIGDERAITSMHKDPYENIYCVISGCKDFILLPPTDRPWIPYKLFPTAVYKENGNGHFDIIPTSEDNVECSTEESAESILDHSTGDGSLSVSEEKGSFGSRVPWICIDPLQPDFENYPLYRNANPVKVTVEAGDALYLPSLWYHHVQQSHGCVAVNYWYNMQFDVKYVYHQMLETLTSRCLSN